MSPLQTPRCHPETFSEDRKAESENLDKERNPEEQPVEKALRDSQARLVGIIDSAMDAIITVDSAQRILVFNRAAEKMFRYSADEAIGQSLDRFMPERFRLTHSAYIQSFGRTGVTTRALAGARTIYGLRSDGAEFPLEASISQVESGEQKLYTIIMRDITERKQAEKAVRESEDRLAFALQVSEIGAWDLDLLDHTAYRSLQHDRIFGYQTTLPTWTYEMFLDHILPEDRHRVDDLFSRARADKGDWSFECRIQRFDGETRWIWASGRHRFDKSGVPRRISGIVQDITERKRAEQENLKLNDELEHRVQERTAQLQAANTELEAFSYSVSHDLRAPLRHINGFSQALLEDYADKLDEEGKGYLQEVRGASQEMGQLIDDVLQLARVTRSEMHREVVNLSELARAVVDELQKRDAGRIIDINIEEGLITDGDKRLLRILLVNLLGNAWKFTSRQLHPQIAFGRKVDDGDPAYFILDNGAGFDMAFADKLFRAFQRLHTVSEFEGTGIGLATVQRIVHRHGGHVWAEGAVDKGATFCFTLPDFKYIKHGEQKHDG
jgi:PAS domain S-box-containing protein